jgi:hypothetical protein
MSVLDRMQAAPGTWQSERLYTRFQWPNGKEKTFETRMAKRVAVSEELELPPAE